MVRMCNRWFWTVVFLVCVMMMGVALVKMELEEMSAWMAGVLVIVCGFVATFSATEAGFLVDYFEVEDGE